MLQRRSRQTNEGAVKPQASSEVNSIRPVKLGFCKVTQTPLQQGSPFKKIERHFCTLLTFSGHFRFFPFYISLFHITWVRQSHSSRLRALSDPRDLSDKSNHLLMILKCHTRPSRFRNNNATTNENAKARRKD